MSHCSILSFVPSLGLSSLLGFLALLGPIHTDAQEPEDPGISPATIEAAEELIGLEFNDAERELMIDDLRQNRSFYQALRQTPLENAVPPALRFHPLPSGATPEGRQQEILWSRHEIGEPPESIERVAFEPIGALAERIRSGQVTATELTRMYLRRLKRHGPKLECVVTLTEELALEQARRADAEIAAGQYRGPLHGIPYGAKDLLAMEGYRTTWGAEPYRDQIREETATVIQRLEEAGAILVAKLSLGSLAWGDVWFAGKTRNPWNLEQGSSGSSAGSAAATAAGLVAFSIGSETWGSIVSPATRCGVTGLRPTFGRVSRAGAMTLSWSMDKIGPICRSVEDCAIVLDTIRGPDGRDSTVVDRPFNYQGARSLRGIRVGYLEELFESQDNPHDSATLEALRDLGVDLIPITLPKDPPVAPLAFILRAEAAAAFDQLTRSGDDDLLVRQIRNAWPNVFRASRLIPAVEYLQANRIRGLLIQEMNTLFKTVDVYIAPTFGGDNLLLTNLTGHPCVVTPNGFNEDGAPTSISFIGGLFNEAAVLAVAKAFQDTSDFHLRAPPAFHVNPTKPNVTPE